MTTREVTAPSLVTIQEICMTQGDKSFAYGEEDAYEMRLMTYETTWFQTLELSP